MGFITKDVPSSAARTAKEAALLLCVFDEEDAWSSAEIAASSMEMGVHGGAYGQSSLEGEEGADADELAT